ncbi:MAG: LytR/AlgR family response regulator transcription factor, partial [Chitinophagaceae bacterium]
YPDVQIAALASNAKEGIQLIRHHHPDVVFLDINMPGMNGFEMLQELQPVSFDTVFITGYDQFAIKAFKYNAFDYLLKPIDTDELSYCIERLKEKKSQTDFQRRLKSLITNLEQPERIPDRLTIHSIDGITVLLIADIIYIEAAGAYSIFYWKDQDKVISSVNLKGYEELLSEQGFFRVHNSFLINMKQVKKILKEDGGCIIMSNGARILLSKRKREEFLRLLEGR